MRQSKEKQLYDMVNGSFRDIALCLGGIFVTNKADDKLIWEIVNSIEDIYYRTVDRLETLTGYGVIFDIDSEKNDAYPHPAIEALLRVFQFKPGVRNAD